jgi:tRNA (adenine37-N6)-methyltransferase
MMTERPENRIESTLISICRVRNAFEEPSLRHSEGDLKIEGREFEPHQMASELIIEPRFERALAGLEGFSHLMVVFWTDLRETEDLEVHPAGQQDIEWKGILSTRSPARPNPLGISTVELLEIKGNVITVKGLDAINGSMIVDIKPHIPYSDAPSDSTIPEWMREIYRRLSPNDLQEEER